MRIARRCHNSVRAFSTIFVPKDQSSNSSTDAAGEIEMPRVSEPRIVAPCLAATRLIVWIALLLVSALLISCGGKAPSLQAPIPNIAGSWEFIAYSSSGSVTGIEVALAEGKVLVNGIEQPNGQITASGTQIAFVALDP